MRKTLSFILSVMMILSVCSLAIPASAAPEGTAINSADEFLAMAAEGKYYLASDITIAASYAAPFTGTFDGNGHTVTVSVPMFADFSGEVKNLTINGEIYSTDASAAAFTVLSAKGFNATNCINNASVTVMGNAKWIGGFVAYCEKSEAPCVFTDCVNNGSIYIDSTADEKVRAGGFGGVIDNVILYNCANNGNVYSKGNSGVSAGFVANAASNKGTNTCEAYGCVNNGKIVAEDTYIAKDGTSQGTATTQAGGIFGHVGVKGNTAWYRVWGCVNNGDIEAPYRVSGIVTYFYASGSTQFGDVQFCINTGDLLYGRTKALEGSAFYDYASPFIAYTNSTSTIMKYNIDTGTLTLREGAVCLNPDKSVIACSGADASKYDVQGNYILNKEQYKYYSYTASESNAASIIDINAVDGIIGTTLEDIKSGKVAYEINALTEKDEYGWAGDSTYYFYQKIGTDNYPCTNPENGWVVLDGTSYKNGDKVEETEPVTEPETEPVTKPESEPETAPETDPVTEVPAVTEAPAVTDPPAPETEPAKGGCGGFVAGGIAIVAILGTALIIKKRD